MTTRGDTPSDRRLADYQHRLVRETAAMLTSGQTTTREKLESLFLYVRDDIKFGFPADGDLVSASETIRTGVGQCNTKGTLFLALCKALGIPARLHFSLIKKEIQRGLFTGFPYRMLPEQISHSWLEVEVDGTWRRIDSYINDLDLYRGANAELTKRGWDTGFSVAASGCATSAAFNLDNEEFMQMGAVTDDQGVWDEPADYYASDLYRNRPGVAKLLLYRLFRPAINRRVARVRAGAAVKRRAAKDRERLEAL